MSLFGAIGTAISGLGSQSAAFGNISDNVANSQTTGFKRIDTSFEDYLTTSTAQENESGAVVAQPDYINNVQGSITQTDNPLALAIAGQGFFAVSQATGVNNGVPSFQAQQYYTRDGNLTMNSNGYLVNDAGQYLNGWSVDSNTNVVNQNTLAPIQVTQTGYNPVATSAVTLSANLPATPAANTATAASPLSSDITVYDSLGTSHVVTLNWAQAQDGNGNVVPNSWTVKITAVDGQADLAGTSNPDPTDLGTADVTFGSNNVPEGTIGQVTQDGTDPGTVQSGGFAAGQPATLSFVTNFGSGDRKIQLNLGTYGSPSGVTQFAGTSTPLINCSDRTARPLPAR
jgi:flagellar hook protein FlgE